VKDKFAGLPHLKYIYARSGFRIPRADCKLAQQVLDSVRVFSLRRTKSASSHANWNLNLKVNMKVLCELERTFEAIISRSTGLPSDTNFISSWS
jgi:hypothetical protein